MMVNPANKQILKCYVHLFIMYKNEINEHANVSC